MSAPAPSAPPVIPEPREPDAWWRHLRVLGWTALLLLALEVALEARAYRRGWDTLLFGQAAVDGAEAEGVFGPTEAFPFRSRIVPAEKPAGTLRIWIASASYALGGNLPVEQVFPVRLGDLLTARGVPSEVLNAGAVAYAIPDSVRRLVEEGPRWRPDVAVLYHLSTDVDELSRSLGAPGGLEAAAGAEGLDWGSRLIERTTLQPLLKEHVSSRVTLARPLLDTLGERGEAAFEARVRAFTAACRALQARPVLCTFAASHDRANPEPLPSHVFRFNLRVSRTGWHATIERWNEVLRRVAREEGLALVDAEASLLGRTPDFVDFVHFSATGHEALALLLADELADELARPAPGRPPAPAADPALAPAGAGRPPR